MRVGPTLEKLRSEYGADVKIVYEQFVMHRAYGTVPALAACAANRQGKFFEMEKLIWDKAFKAGRDFRKDNIDGLAQEAGLDMARYRRDIGQPCQDEIAKQHRELAQVGLRKVPAFYVNGRFVRDGNDEAALKRVVEEELHKADQRIRAGTRPEDYYRVWVLERGLQHVEPARPPSDTL